MESLPFERLVYQEIDNIRQASDGRIPDDTLRRLDCLFQHDPILEVALEHIDNNDITRCTAPSGRYYYQLSTTSSNSFRSSSSSSSSSSWTPSALTFTANTPNNNKSFGLTPTLERNPLSFPSSASTNPNYHHYHEPYIILIHHSYNYGNSNHRQHHHHPTTLDRHHHYCSCLRFIVQNTFTTALPSSLNRDTSTLTLNDSVQHMIDLSISRIELPLPINNFPSLPRTTVVVSNPTVTLTTDTTTITENHSTKSPDSLPIYYHSFCKHLLAVLIADALGEERYRKQEITEEQLIEALARY